MNLINPKISSWKNNYLRKGLIKIKAEHDRLSVFKKIKNIFFRNRDLKRFMRQAYEVENG